MFGVNIWKGRNRMFKIKRTIAVILILTAQLSTPLKALAVDTSYIDQYWKWNEAENAQAIITYLDGYNGCLQFFYADNCFYAHISYNESSLSDNENRIFVTVNISNENRNYTVTLENGIDTENEYCNIYKSFTPDTKLGQDIYFIIEFTDKADKNTVNVLNIQHTVNSNSYFIGENISVGAESQQSDSQSGQVNNTTYKMKSEEENSEPESQTKFHYDVENGVNSKENASENSQSAKTSKFSAQEDYSSVSEESENNNDIQNGESAQSVRMLKTSELSTGAKAMLAGSGVIATAGCVFIFKALLGKAVEKEAQKIAAQNVSENNGKPDKE